LGGEERCSRCWRRVSKGNEEEDGDWGGGGRVVEVNFKGRLGWVGRFVGMGYTGLVGKRAPSISERERDGIVVDSDRLELVKIEG
jgi:hypothetical protein